MVGASSRIGAATAGLASVLGARVLLASRSRAKLDAVRAGLARPAEAETLVLDYLDPASVAEALAPFDRIDHALVPAVADENKKRRALLELADGTMRASFDKFWGQVNLLRAALPFPMPMRC